MYAHSMDISIMYEESVGGDEALQSCTTTFTVTMFRSRRSNKVLFLEAGKGFVDTLFSFLILPLGTILHILSQGVQVKPLNGISSIFESVDSSFLVVDKKTLVQPRPAAPAGCPCRSDYGDLKVQVDLEAADILQPPKKRLVLPAVLYMCNGCSDVSSSQGTRCEHCKNSYFTYRDGLYSAYEKDPNEGVSCCKGFVKDSVTFIITDKLEITPSTTIMSMSVLTKVGVASLSDLESSEVTVSISQVLIKPAFLTRICLQMYMRCSLYAFKASVDTPTTCDSDHFSFGLI